MYKVQKEKVKGIVKEEIYKHEKKITDEIKSDKNRKLWDNINFLRGKNKNRNSKADIYNNDGIKLECTEARGKINEFWKTIYQRNENEIAEKWQNAKEEYERHLENEQILANDMTFPYQIQ